MNQLICPKCHCVFPNQIEYDIHGCDISSFEDLEKMVPAQIPVIEPIAVASLPKPSSIEFQAMPSEKHFMFWGIEEGRPMSILGRDVFEIAKISTYLSDSNFPSELIPDKYMPARTMAINLADYLKHKTQTRIADGSGVVPKIIELFYTQPFQPELLHSLFWNPDIKVMGDEIVCKNIIISNYKEWSLDDFITIVMKYHKIKLYFNIPTVNKLGLN